ncbi:Spondin-2 [Lamellibrachia satsuma]|nr:Spondin-2 [Lamellibrachia satsuma]
MDAGSKNGVVYSALYFGIIILIISAADAVGGQSSDAAAACRAEPIVKYSLTLQTFWARKYFPKQYPRYRPRAQWSKLIGRSHDDTYSLWQLEQPATRAMRQFSERGISNRLESERQGAGGVLDTFLAPRMRRGSGKTTVEFFVDTQHPKISVASRLIPSPDWFVGLDSLDLCRGGDWLDQLSVDLDPHDAGTDRGLTFTSPNWVQDPAKPILRINSSYPSHQACSFYYPNITKLPIIARVFISKQAWYESGGKETVNTRVDAGTAKRKGRISKQRKERPRNLQRQLQRKGAPVDCQVSKWSEFTQCSKSCGYGNRKRSRTVVREERNGGKPCPPLVEQTLCGGMGSCGWQHFTFDKYLSEEG